MKSKREPVFKEGCSECIFLAHFNKSDLYYCKTGEKELDSKGSSSTILKARYGHNRQNFVTCGFYSQDCDVFKELAEAQRLAIEKGYFKGKIEEIVANHTDVISKNSSDQVSHATNI